MHSDHHDELRGDYPQMRDARLLGWMFVAIGAAVGVAAALYFI